MLCVCILWNTISLMWKSTALILPPWTVVKQCLCYCASGAGHSVQRRGQSSCLVWHGRGRVWVEYSHRCARVWERPQDVQLHRCDHLPWRKDILRCRDRLLSERNPRLSGEHIFKRLIWYLKTRATSESQNWILIGIKSFKYRVFNQFSIFCVFQNLCG